MSHRDGEAGFTIAEMVITLVVLSLFLMLFFQLYILGLSQKNAVILRATANDIALNNLRKITSKDDIPAEDACDDTTNDSTNPNNATLNLDLNNDGATGSSIIGQSPGDNNPYPDSPTLESLDNTGLPSSTTQTLYVIYPQGCYDQNPAKIISIVTYNSEIVTHATYVN